VLKGYTEVTFLKSPKGELGNFSVLNKFLEGVYDIEIR